jgi:hypothetical protein
MQEVHCIKRMYEAVDYQVRRAVRAGDRMDLPTDLGWFVPAANRRSRIGSDPMSISLLCSAKEQVVGLPAATRV